VKHKLIMRGRRATNVQTPNVLKSSHVCVALLKDRLDIRIADATDLAPLLCLTVRRAANEQEQCFVGRPKAPAGLTALLWNHDHFSGACGRNL